MKSGRRDRCKTSKTEYQVCCIGYCVKSAVQSCPSPSQQPPVARRNLCQVVFGKEKTCTRTYLVYLTLTSHALQQMSPVLPQFRPVLPVCLIPCGRPTNRLSRYRTGYRSRTECSMRGGRPKHVLQESGARRASCGAAHDLR